MCRIEELIAPKKGQFTEEELAKCIGKSKHGSAHDAHLAAVEHTRQTGDKMKGYRCRLCGFFHIGHPRKVAK